MNAKSLVPGIALSLVMATGCASLKEKFNDAVGYVRIEDVKAQLASSDKVQIETAEKEIYSIATRGTSSKGFVSYTEAEQLQFLDLTKNQELLSGIAMNARDSRMQIAAIKKLEDGLSLINIIENNHSDLNLVAAASEQIDLSKPGIALEVLKHYVVGPVAMMEDDRKRRIAWSANASEGEKTPSFSERVVAALDEKDVVEAFKLESLPRDVHEIVERRMLTTTKDIKFLESIFAGGVSGYSGYPWEEELLYQRMGELGKSISDKKIALKLLNAKDMALRYVVKSAKARSNLLSRLSKDEAVEFALKSIKNHRVEEWHDKDLVALHDGIIVMALFKDAEKSVDIVSALFYKLTSHRSDCRNSWMHWTDEDREQEKKLIARFPKFTGATLERLICECSSAWRLLDQVPEDMAYRILTSGRAPMDSTEVDLLKKLSPAKIDMAVYNGVKYDETKKELEKLMTPEMKQQIAEANAKKVEEILAKAKDAAKDTFEFNGFYLGMKWEDVKTLFVHYFPDFEFTETKGDDGLPELYVSYQRSPFCLANKDGVAVQFNFGKKILKKWIQYDVQNEHEWANKYAADNKIDMNFKMITKKATVYERDLSASYTVLFYQNSYQYRNNAKEYRLTYFGEEKDWTIEGGVGGALIKEMAAPKFKYTRGDQGSLRAGIERD